jgi:hypothetical protein
MSILLEVSIGEALDKLSILDIKRDKIKNPNRLIHVEKEYEYLFDKLNIYLSQNTYFYKMLKKVNLEIWELQDIIRGCNKHDISYNDLTEKILNLNDSRFLIKNKLNFIMNSNFIEQKGYNKRVLFFNIKNLSLDELNILNIGVRYYSLYYDNIILNINENYIKEISDNYKDDVTITVVTNVEIISNYDIIDFELNIKLLKHTFFINKKEENNENENEITHKIYSLLNLNFKEIKKYMDY